MSVSSPYPKTAEEDDASWALVTRSVEPGVQLPDWPFVRDDGWVTFCQWNDVISGDFGDVFRALCEHHGDDCVVVATFNRGGVRRLTDGRLLPIVRLESAELSKRNYWTSIQAQPGSLYAFPLFPGAEVVAATGSSGRWAVWAQVDWEVGVVLSTRPPGSWLNVVDDLSFVDLDFALSNYMQQALGDRAMSEATRESFWSVFASRDRGDGL